MAWTSKPSMIKQMAHKVSMTTWKPPMRLLSIRAGMSIGLLFVYFVAMAMRVSMYVLAPYQYDLVLGIIILFNNQKNR